MVNRRAEIGERSDRGTDLTLRIIEGEGIDGGIEIGDIIVTDRNI